DGIRDLTVTGVQTCALPIWGGDQPARLDPGEEILAAHVPRTTKSAVGVGNPFRLTSPIGSNSSPSLAAIAVQTASVTSTSPASRAEERRVGQQCGARRRRRA